MAGENGSSLAHLRWHWGGARRRTLFSSLCLLSLLAWSQTPDPAVLQRAVADAECLEVEFLETNPPVRIRIQDPKIIRDLAGAMKLSSAGFSTIAVQQSGHVFNIRVVPKKQGEAVHEFSLCLRHLIWRRTNERTIGNQEFGTFSKFAAGLAVRCHSGGRAEGRISAGRRIFGSPFFSTRKTGAAFVFDLCLVVQCVRC